MKATKAILAAALSFGLSGCVGLAVKSGAQALFGDKDKPPAERIASEQGKALSSVHGGSAGTPIAWSDTASGIEGSLVADAGADDADGCRRYQETVILVGETLQGPVMACAQKDGSWKISTAERQAQR